VAFIAVGCGQELGHDQVDATSDGASRWNDRAPEELAPDASDSELPLGLEGAELVVTGTVDRVTSDFGRNERGDELIISTVSVRVRETLRGEAPSIVEFALEGGTVGGLTLKVSDVPKLKPGDEGSFALRRSVADARWVPNRGAEGIRVLQPSPALEWVSTSKWDVGVVHYRVNPSNNDVTNAQALSGVRIGADAWTAQSGAAFRYVYDGTSTSSTIGMNGTNLVVFLDEQGSSPTTRATSYQWMIGATIVESDIAFWDGSMDFVTGSMPCTDSIYIENTGIHEFGHSLGLEHSPVTTATMYGHSAACSKSRLELDPDDIAGVEALYPCSNNSQCNDAKLCTNDVCQGNTCVRTPIAGCCTSTSECGDGNACTTDTCESNECVHESIAGCCNSASQCGDGNACTADTCESHECVHESIADCCTSAGQCDDGDPCTEDTCDANQCANVPIEDCTSSGADAGPADAAGDSDGPAGDTDGPAQTYAPDAGASDAGGFGAAAPDPLTGGCACTTVTESGRRTGWVGLACLLVLAWVAQRRRFKRRASPTARRDAAHAWSAHRSAVGRGARRARRPTGR